VQVNWAGNANKEEQVVAADFDHCGLATLTLKPTMPQTSLQRRTKMAMKKLTFPNRPCPKCGKPIHIKTKRHEECGWTMTRTAEAPRTSDVNKSAAVREIVQKNPKVSVRQVVFTLASQGIKVSNTYVYAIKTKMKAKKRKEKREKALETSNSIGISDPVDLIREVKNLALRTGGLRNLRQLVDVLAE
jgi:hypothetical protein